MVVFWAGGSGVGGHRGLRARRGAVAGAHACFPPAILRRAAAAAAAGAGGAGEPAHGHRGPVRPLHRGPPPGAPHGGESQAREVAPTLAAFFQDPGSVCRERNVWFLKPGRRKATPKTCPGLNALFHSCERARIHAAPQGPPGLWTWLCGRGPRSWQTWWHHSLWLAGSRAAVANLLDLKDHLLVTAALRVRLRLRPPGLAQIPPLVTTPGRLRLPPSLWAAHPVPLHGTPAHRPSGARCPVQGPVGPRVHWALLPPGHPGPSVSPCAPHTLALCPHQAAPGPPGTGSCSGPRPQ